MIYILSKVGKELKPHANIETKRIKREIVHEQIRYL